jgi:DNA-binding response OmpR family regulator
MSDAPIDAQPAPSPQPDALARVLLVDDEPANLEVLARRLRVRRFEVFTARSGREVGKFLIASPPDIILMDVMMPGVSGLETLREIRKLKSSTELPVIMLTAKDDKETIVEAIATGANDYVVKPYQFDILIARMVAQLKVRAGFQAMAAERAQLLRRLAVREQLTGQGKEPSVG